MNYSRIYRNIIEHRKIVPSVSSYKERHHIIPKCMGGTDQDDNLVELSAREHFFVHQLLAKMFPIRPLIGAAYLMSNYNQYGSRRYEWIKTMYSETQRKRMTGTKQSEETRLKRSASLRGKPRTQEVRDKISASKRGVPKTEETRRKMSEAQTGRVWSEEDLQRRAEKQRGKNKGRVFSDETKQRMSESAKNRPKRTLSEEHKRKISEARRKSYL
jgi:hypothetical protein